MKAITIRQPWASLIAAGVKTIETRPRRSNYRGRVAIHAGKAKPPWCPRCNGSGLVAPGSCCPECGGIGVHGLCAEVDALPLGAVVASALLTDCVPIIDETYTIVDRQWPDGPFVYADPGNFIQVHDGPDDSVPRYSEDEVHLGDFTPGRWALLLDDIKPTTERCPACWGTRCNAPADAGHTAHDHPRRQCFWCPTCGGKGTCDPVAAKGQQAVPWEWTP